MNTCGVYKITNLSSGRFYIGSAQNIYQRKKRHFKSLREQNHHNIFLQRVYNKYGEEDFKVQYMKTEDVDSARRLEQKLLNKHHGDSKCMNIGRDACGGDNLTHNPRREKIVKKMTQSVRKMMAALTPEERIEKFGRPGALNGMYGKTHDDVARKKMSAANVGSSRNLGIKQTEVARENMSRAARIRCDAKDYVNPFAGKKHSAETLAFLATVNAGRTPANARRVKVGKKKYDSLRAAADSLGLVPATILYRIRSKNYPDHEYID